MALFKKTTYLKAHTLEGLQNLADATFINSDVEFKNELKKRVFWSWKILNFQILWSVKVVVR